MQTPKLYSVQAHKVRSGLNTSTQAWTTVPNGLQGRAAYDGVFQNGTVFLGGSDPVFNKGITLVHEVGHVSPLFHVQCIDDREYALTERVVVRSVSYFRERL